MVSSFLAGIRALLIADWGGLKTWVADLHKNAANRRAGGRLHVGTPGRLKSEAAVVNIRATRAVSPSWKPALSVSHVTSPMKMMTGENP
jgi:hypothetical protein